MTWDLFWSRDLRFSCLGSASQRLGPLYLFVYEKNLDYLFQQLSCWTSTDVTKARTSPVGAEAKTTPSSFPPPNVDTCWGHAVFDTDGAWK